MTTRRDPLAESFRAALDAEAADVSALGSAEDDALLARAIEGAMASTGLRVAATTSSAPPVAEAPAAARGSAPPAAVSTGSLRPLGSARQARLRMLRYALPAAAALVASVAMGAVYMSYRAKPAPANDVTHLPQGDAPPALDAPAARPGPASVAPPPAAPASEGAPSISVDDLPSVAARGSASAAHPGGDGVHGLAPTTATAAELFRDANASRRAGEVDKAVDLYSSLLAHHADTPEAHAARVSLGRLLLDRRGDAAGALVQFDAYLKSSSSDRALAEEARLGRALVFQRQGRHEEERRAWHELLERHPDTLYASRARERLRALSPAESAPALAPSSPAP